MANKFEAIISARDETKQAIDSAVGGFGRLKQSADGLLSGGLSGLTGGLAAGLLGAGFTATIKEAIDSLDKMDEAAERIGMTTEALSGLSYAGKMSGVEFDDMASALSRLSVKMSDAVSGNKEAAAWFKDIGISTKDLVGADGSLISVDEAMGKVATSFSGLKDGAAKTALAVDGFGKSGAQLVPLLNQGAEGLKGMVEEGKAFGAIIDSKLAKQAADFNDNMDKLAFLSAAAGKSIASELLPTMNRLSTEFLIGLKNSDGFFDALMKYGMSNPFKSSADQLSALNKEAQLLEDKISIGKGGSGDEERLRSLQQQLNYYREIEKYANGPASDGDKSGGKKNPNRTSSATGGKTKEQVEATDAAKEYAKAMEGLAKASFDADAAQLNLSGTQKTLMDLMRSPEWANMPEEWRLAAAAQFEVAYATEQAAEKQKRLNKLLGEADSSKIEAAREDVLLLTAALEDGTISEEKYIEAVSARLGGMSDTAEKSANNIDTVITNAFGNAADAVIDFGLTGKASFGDMVTSMIRDLLRLELQMQATSAYKSMGGISGIISSLGSFFGDFASSSSGGNSTPGFGSGDLGSGIRSADGNVFSGAPGLHQYVNTVQTTPKFFEFGKLHAFANGGIFAEAGPEAVMPLKRGKDGRLGVSAESQGGVTINITNNTDASVRTEQRSDGKGGSIVDVIFDQIDSKMASNIIRGSGSTTAAIQQTFDVSRKAGAY